MCLKGKGCVQLLDKMPRGRRNVGAASVVSREQEYPAAAG